MLYVPKVNTYKNSAFTLLQTHFYRQRKQKKNYEGFDNLLIILLIPVYALAKIRQFRYKRPVEKYAWYDTRRRLASRRQRFRVFMQCATGPQ